MKNLPAPGAPLCKTGSEPTSPPANKKQAQMGEGLPRQDIGVIFLLYCKHFLGLSDKLKVYF